MSQRDKDALLRGAYQAAEGIMRERAASFYQAFSQLPRQRFLSVAAIYAFCRFADDTVDQVSAEAAQSRLDKLDILESRLRSLYPPEAVSAQASPLGKSPQGEAFIAPNTQLSGEPALDPWWPAFAHTVALWQIPLAGFLAQIQGQRLDADFPGIPTVLDLVAYGRLVAGSVGIMLAPILADDGADPNDPAFLSACSDLGVAMQITNILRDVGEDLRGRGRLYLPLELMTKHGVSKEELMELAQRPPEEDITQKIPAAFIALWEELATLADEYYQPYELWLDHFHQSSRMPLLAAALMYHAIADAVRGAGYNCLTRRCYTDDSTRNRLLLQAMARA